MKSVSTIYWVLSLLALLLFMGLWIGSGSYPEIWRLQARIVEQKGDNKDLIERNRKLQADVSNITDSDKAIEAHARSELGMVKKGETYYQIILKDQEQQTLQTIAPPLEQ